MTRFGTDFRHQYGIFGGESQTSFTRNATRAGSEEGRLFSQAKGILETVSCRLQLRMAWMEMDGILKKLANFSSFDATCSKNPQEIYYG